MPDNLSIYIHYPFCKAKCPYCDFNSHIMEVNNDADWQKAYISELEYFLEFTKNSKISTIFFGGGTPSLMPISLIEAILNKIYALYKVAPDVEISLEANPTSSEALKFQNFKSLGINRLSIGVQSLIDEDLKFLGRKHSASEALKTIETAKKYFNNFSFDLIYARPKQTLKSWEKELKQALKLDPPHLSLYQLTIEKGTEFFNLYRDKKFKLADQEKLADFYELTDSICANANLIKYETSNYAKKEFEAKHNLNYWLYGDYIGIGAGAHARITQFDSEKHYFMTFHNPLKWLNKTLESGNGIQQKKILTKEEIIEEILMNGLRINEAISKNIFEKYIGKNHIELFGSKLDDLRDEGLILYDADKILTTNKGAKILNSIITYLVS